METTYLIIGFISGGILGAVILYFILKSSTVSRNSYDELNHLFIKSNSDLENSTLKINELSQNIAKEKEINLNQSDLMNDLKAEFASRKKDPNSDYSKVIHRTHLFHRFFQMKNQSEYNIEKFFSNTYLNVISNLDSSPSEEMNSPKLR